MGGTPTSGQTATAPRPNGSRYPRGAGGGGMGVRVKYPPWWHPQGWGAPVSLWVGVQHPHGWGSSPIMGGGPAPSWVGVQHPHALQVEVAEVVPPDPVDCRQWTQHHLVAADIRVPPTTALTPPQGEFDTDCVDINVRGPGGGALGGECRPGGDDGVPWGQVGWALVASWGWGRWTSHGHGGPPWGSIRTETACGRPTWDQLGWMWGMGDHHGVE